MTKTILVTGCAGFIGSNFVKKLVKNKNYNFIGIDALTYAGHTSTIKEEISESNFTFFPINILDEIKLRELFQEYQFSGIIHFAAESHVDRSIDNPQIFVQTNVLGTLNLLNFSLKYCPSVRFCHISTDEVYGELEKFDPPFTERTPLNPRSPYSASKASSDQIALSYFHTYGLDVICTRCSNNYGPYQLREKLIPLMIDKALNSEKLPVYGSGKNIRDWIFVEDHVEGIWLAYNKGEKGEVYNLGGGNELENISVVRMILKELNKSFDLISFVKDRLGHDFRYAIDYTKAKEKLGFIPKMNFEKGLKYTINWYEDNRSWPES